MKVFTRDEIELLRLEASRQRIANLRAKLQQMKKLVRPLFDRGDPGDESDGDPPSHNRRD